MRILYVFAGLLCALSAIAGVAPCPEDWTKVGGLGNPFIGNRPKFETSPVFYDCKMYVGGDQGVDDSDLWAYDYNDDSWTVVAGHGVNGSWDGTSMPPSSFYGVDSMTVHDGELWVGLENEGGAIGAEIYSFDGLTWTKRGGQGLNGSWPAGLAVECHSLVSYNGKLFCAIWFPGAFDKTRMYAWDGTLWTQVGGSGINGSWAVSPGGSFAPQPTVWNNKLYLLGWYADPSIPAELWEYDDLTSVWRMISLPISPASLTTYFFNEIYGDIDVYRGQLVVALGEESGPTLWTTSDLSFWSQIGGPTIPGSWTSISYQEIRVVPWNEVLLCSLINGDLPGFTDIWQYDGITNSWSIVARADDGYWSDPLNPQPAYGHTTDAACVAWGIPFFTFNGRGGNSPQVWRMPVDLTPPEVVGVTVRLVNPIDPSFGIHMEWDSLAEHAEQCGGYQVIGGYIDELWANRGFARSLCKATGLNIPVFEDMPNRDQWYLVRGVGCGKGTVGSSFYVPPTTGPDYRDFLDSPVTDPCP